MNEQLNKSNLYEQSCQAAKVKILEKAAWNAKKGHTECNMLVDGIGFPPMETVRQLLLEGYDVIYSSVHNLGHEIIAMSWEESSGKVYKRTLLRKRKSSVEKMYKYFRKIGI